MVDLADRLRGLILSAADLQKLTKWKPALIEDYLNILDNIILIANELQPILDLDPDKLVRTDSDSMTISVDDLTEFVLPTDTEIDTTDNLDGTATISISDDYLPDHVLETVNQVGVTNNLDGTIYLTLPQDFDINADVELANLELTGGVLTLPDLGVVKTDDGPYLTFDGEPSAATRKNMRHRIVPVGSGVKGAVELYGSDDLTNFERLVVGANLIDLNVFGIDSDSDGTGTTRPIALYIDGSEKARVDTDGNVGINIAIPTSKLHVSGSVTTDRIIFNLLAGLSPNEGELSWNADDGTLDLGLPGGNVTLQVGLESLVRVVNKSGADIANGKLVYVSGSQGQRDTIGLADNTDVNTIYILGMTTEDIDDNANGYVTRFGYVRGSVTEPIDTSGMVEGDTLYLGTAGGWTKTHPPGATDAVVVIGTVNQVHATNGVISLQPAKSFTIGNEFNGTIRQSVVNKSTGIAAAAGFTAINNLGYFTTIGIAGSGNTTFPNNVSVHYAPGYGDHWQAVDGNKDFVWFTDPTDSHDNSSLTNEVMRLVAAGHLKLVKDNSKMMWGAGDDASIAYDGTDLNIKTDEVAPSDLKIECGANKTLELQNVVYEDWYFEIAPKTVGAGKPTLTSFSGNINQWTMGVNDVSELRPVEFAHRWKEATQIEIHVHWGTNGLDGTNRGVKWEIDYTWANGLGLGTMEAFAAATTVSAETQIPANTPDKTNMYTSVVSFTPTGGVIGATLLMSLKRIASITDPTPSSEPWVFMVGVHYQANTMGSRQIGVK
jgi:hypothetical protein